MSRCLAEALLVPMRKFSAAEKGKAPKEAKGGSAQAAEGEKEQEEQKEQKEGEGE